MSMEECPQCGGEYRIDNGSTMSDMDWHAMREHGVMFR